MQGFYTRIENDALDIAARLKEIDDGYFIVYNGYFKRLEVHNKKQGKTPFVWLCRATVSTRAPWSLSEGRERKTPTDFWRR